MNKIILIVILIFFAAGAGIAYYMLAPLWRSTELNEPSPLGNASVFKDVFETMDEETMMRFKNETDGMKDKVLSMEEEMPGQARLLKEGEFKPRAHEVKGKALLIEQDGQKIIRFENFETINGPNVDIYLASELGDRDIVNLGDIRATSGNINYPVPAGTDTDRYNKVLVWCKDFRVLFSYAELR